MRQKMKKILYVSNCIDEFQISFINSIKEKGAKVDVFENKKKLSNKEYNMPFSKRIISIKNIKEYIRLKKLIKNNQYNYIYCYKTTAGFFTRIATRKDKNSKIIYINPSLEFYKGAGIKKWFFLWIEKILAKYTNLLITMNNEDYNNAKKYLKIPYIKKINAIKINSKKIENNIDKKEKNKILQEFMLKDNDYIFLSTGDLTKEKNQIMQIEAMIRVTEKYPNAKLLIEGEGKLKLFYSEVIHKYGVDANVQLIGKREDAQKILEACDCYISTSKKEEYPINVVRATILGKKVIATKIRGHIDLLEEKNLVSLKDSSQLINKMEESIISKKINAKQII